MSDSTQQYILAKPIDWQDALDINDYMGGNELFVPLDIPVIEKQLKQDKELFRIASLIGCEPEDEERHRKQLVDYVMAEILVLLGLENKETD